MHFVCWYLIMIFLTSDGILIQTIRFAFCFSFSSHTRVIHGYTTPHTVYLLSRVTSFHHGSYGRYKSTRETARCCCTAIHVPAQRALRTKCRERERASDRPRTLRKRETPKRDTLHSVKKKNDCDPWLSPKLANMFSRFYRSIPYRSHEKTITNRSAHFPLHNGTKSNRNRATFHAIFSQKQTNAIFPIPTIPSEESFLTPEPENDHHLEIAALVALVATRGAPVDVNKYGGVRRWRHRWSLGACGNDVLWRLCEGWFIEIVIWKRRWNHVKRW